MKRFLSKIILGILLSNLAACTPYVEPSNAPPPVIYHYAPRSASEKPATVMGSPINLEFMKVAAGSAYITHIDGMQVSEIDDGGWQWMMIGSNMKGIYFNITPGVHVFTVAIKAGSVATTQFKFNAKAGEHYTFKASNEARNNYSPARYRMRFENEKGEPVTQDQTLGDYSHGI